MQRRAAKLSLLLSGTTGLLLMLCSPAAAGEPTTATAGKARSFSLDDVAPVFTGPASTAFREKRHAEAARLFEAFLEEHGDDPRAPRARLLAGLARARSGDGKAAAALLEGLHARLPRTLAPYARILAAEQLLPDTPEKALAELSGLPAGTPLQRKAELLRAQALEAAGKREQAVALLDELIRSGKAGASELKLAARLARDGDRDEQAEQLERKLWIEHPLSEAARGLSEPSRLTADERIRRGQAFYERDRHALALEELERVLVPSTAKAGRCQARFLRGHTHFKSRRYAPAVDELQHYFDEGCPAAGDEVQKARALYYAGRSAARSGRSALAVGFFERLARELPRSNLADDALLLASEVLVDQGQPKKAAAALQKIVEHVAHGDMLEEAWFRLAWARYLKGELKEALKVLTRAATAGVRGTDYYSRGRLLYWRARILGRTGKRDEAIRLYRQIVRKEPLSYYAQLAASRLRATHPRHLQGLFPRPEKVEGWTFAPRLLFGEPGFRRALELLRVGLDTEAQHELEALGLLDGRNEEDLWLAALLFERAGSPQRSHDIARRRIPGYQDHPPDAGHARFWHVAYPRPFQAQVEAAARGEGVSAELLFGLVREESAFIPHVVSYADAIGLTQLLLETARMMAGKQRDEVTEQSLRRPELNLKLGARFLRQLLDRFGHPALAIAGYNAGGGAVRRWLDRWPSLNPDELVECIPYEQTRNYTKRVIEAHGRYHFLYGTGEERFLDLPLTAGKGGAVATGKKEKGKEKEKEKAKAGRGSKGAKGVKGAKAKTERAPQGARSASQDQEDLPPRR